MPQESERAIRVDKSPRIHLWPLTLRLLLSLVLPVCAALLLDWTLGTLPWLTMVTSLICIPLATVIVGNATLRDFERVVALVAPKVTEGPVESAELTATVDGQATNASDSAVVPHVR